jgi:hypothetical protein
VGSVLYFADDRRCIATPLTAEQLASLVDLAMVTPSPKIPALHLTRLMVLGYVM